MRTPFGAQQRRRLARAIAVVPLALSMTAGAAEIRVFTSGAPAEVQKRLAVEFARDAGHRVTFTVGNPAGIRQRLASGETPDIVVLPAPTIEALEKAGTLRPGSRVDLARVGIGVVVRAGAPLPDISTVAAVRALLRDARSVVYPDPAGGGQTGLALARMTQRLGMAETVEPKLTLKQAMAGGVDLVATGAVELGMFNISEVLAVKGITLVGPLPPELQSWLVFAAAIHAGNAAPAPAEAFIRFMTDPYARAQWRAGGLKSLGGGS